VDRHHKCRPFKILLRTIIAATSLFCLCLTMLNRIDHDYGVLHHQCRDADLPFHARHVAYGSGCHR